MVGPENIKKQVKMKHIGKISTQWNGFFPNTTPTFSISELDNSDKSVAIISNTMMLLQHTHIRIEPESHPIAKSFCTGS